MFPTTQELCYGISQWQQQIPFLFWNLGQKESRGKRLCELSGSRLCPLQGVYFALDYQKQASWQGSPPSVHPTQVQQSCLFFVFAFFMTYTLPTQGERTLMFLRLSGAVEMTSFHHLLTLAAHMRRGNPNVWSKCPLKK